MAILTTMKGNKASDPYKQRTHSGLSFLYGVGAVRADNVVLATVAGNVTLDDDDTSYIETTTAGVVSENVVGFTVGSIPLYTVVTASGAITSVQDDRCFLSAGGSGSESNRGIAFYLDGDIAVEADSMSFIAPIALTVTSVKLAVSTAPTDADLIIDINKNGTTMFTTQGNRPEIAASATSGTSVAPDVTAIAIGDLITLDIDQVGSTIAGANLAVTVICEVA